MDRQVDLQLLRTKMRAGKMPVSPKHRLFGGPGDGTPCACCDRIITRYEMAFEVECLVSGTLVVLAMHTRCFDAWIAEARAASPGTG